MRGTKEFYELQAQFEKVIVDEIYGHKIERVGKDDNAPARYFYNDGFVNTLFHAYMLGYQHAKCSLGL
jgi:hypothetical protein